MSEESFLADIQEILELDELEMHIKDDFRTYDEWDSLTFLALVTHMRDEYGVELDIDTFNKITCWEDLYRLTAAN